ncbi:hypothetical protein BHM03_00015978 [Ensete ventricosum]|nr:hypothetical protein BHM03_00015978 [Ensete ventricosum]
MHSPGSRSRSDQRRYQRDQQRWHRKYRFGGARPKQRRTSSAAARRWWRQRQRVRKGGGGGGGEEDSYLEFVRGEDGRGGSRESESL